MTLIGATTENPYFEVNARAAEPHARSTSCTRSSAADIETLLRRALERGECGDGDVPDDVLAFLAARAGGDARTALAALELACATRPRRRASRSRRAEEALQRKALRYDRAGDQHYDYISAWIKATRASDPDAALYYLAVMLEGGEDARFIVRRMVVLASEDIGNADPQALVVATAAAAAVEHVGLPECSPRAVAGDDLPRAGAEVQGRDALDRRPRSPRRATPRRASPPPQVPLAGAVGYDSPHDHPAHLGPQEVAPDEVGGHALLRARRAGGGAARAPRGDPRAGAAGAATARTQSPMPATATVRDRRSSRSARSTGRRLGSVAATASGRRRRGRRRGRRGPAAVGAAAPERPRALPARAPRRRSSTSGTSSSQRDRREQGRPIAEAQTMELLPAVETLQWLAEAGPRMLGPERVGLSRVAAAAQARAADVRAARRRRGARRRAPSRSRRRSATSRVALMGGNGVVLHPSPLAALAAERIARVFARAGLPEGLLQIVHGDAETRARSSSRRRSRTCASPAPRRPAATSARRARASSSARRSRSAARTRCSCSPTRTSPRAVAGARVGRVRQRRQSGGSVARALRRARARRALPRRRRGRGARAARRRSRATRTTEWGRCSPPTACERAGRAARRGGRRRRDAALRRAVERRPA